jgi:hypothetical protein
LEFKTEVILMGTKGMFTLRKPVPGTPIGPSQTTTAQFEIVSGLLPGMNAAPEIRGVNKR